MGNSVSKAPCTYPRFPLTALVVALFFFAIAETFAQSGPTIPNGNTKKAIAESLTVINGDPDRQMVPDSLSPYVYNLFKLARDSLDQDPGPASGLMLTKKNNIGNTALSNVFINYFQIDLNTGRVKVQAFTDGDLTRRITLEIQVSNNGGVLQMYYIIYRVENKQAIVTEENTIGPVLGMIMQFLKTQTKYRSLTPSKLDRI